MAKLSLYPKKITQPNKNKSSGLAGNCFKEVRRNGKKYNVNCGYQKDPKYHHQWINTENLKIGKTAQCGKESKYFCNHKTYYGIKGYRNTCPIAGVSGTYTQPATLRMYFDYNRLPATSKINNITIKFKHRCVGVDVANSSTTVKWGPNFYGFSHYPKRKVLTFQFINPKKSKSVVSETSKKPNGSDFSNPPLSTNYSEVTAVLKNISYEDLRNGYLDIKYGNNLSTNPGNIYITGFKIDIDYDPKAPYIEGVASADSLITTTENTECATSITFDLEVGYKTGNKKIIPETTELQNRVEILQKPEGVIYNECIGPEKNKVKLSIKDLSGIGGKKKIIFGLKNTNEKIEFEFEAKTKKKPIIDIPPIFEHNVLEENIPIIARKGCASNIKFYADGLNTNPIYEITTDKINLNYQENILICDCNKENNNCGGDPDKYIKEIYATIAQLPCGFHTIYVQIDDAPKDKIEQHRIRIDPVQHKFSFTIDNKKSNVINQSEQSSTLKITYETKKNFISGKAPKFSITNPLKEDGTDIKTIWNTETKKYIEKNLVKTKPGTYNIVLTETNGCEQKTFKYPVIIEPTHKQYYDTLFVKTEGPTPFDCEYLTVWEGDRLNEPVYMKNITLKNSPNNLCFYAPQKSQSGLTEISYFPLSIKNKGNTDINNLFVELNALKDNNGQLEVTTDEWIETDGMFINFKNNFEELNMELENLVSVVNLTPDNDFIDEEDVYIKINEIKAGKSINLKIPFGTRIEKEVILQLLMFEIPIQIYPNINCTGKKFTDIKLNTFDSILTDLRIDGDFELPNVVYDEETGNCYFQTDNEDENKRELDITYTAKNIDTSSLKASSSLVIENDPRLIPVGIIENGNVSSIESSTKIRYEGGTVNKETPLINKHIFAKFNFLDDISYEFEATTDESGKARFFVTIPEQDNNEYTIQDIMNEAVLEYKGTIECSPAKLEKGVNQYNQTKFNYLDDNNTYKKNETIIITILLTTELPYLQNKLIFNANIRTPGKQDSITIRYRIYNLKNQTGTLYTKFKTDELELIPNEIIKNIYCRVNTNLILNSYLLKKVVEEKEINTLYVSLTNRDRENKNIQVIINEIDSEEYDILYDTFNDNIDIGKVSIENEVLTWTIEQMDKDEIIRGVFDFIAKDLENNSTGLSQIQVNVTDFMSERLLPINPNCNCN